MSWKNVELSIVADIYVLTYTQNQLAAPQHVSLIFAPSSFSNSAEIAWSAGCICYLAGKASKQARIQASQAATKLHARGALPSCSGGRSLEDEWLVGVCTHLCGPCMRVRTYALLDARCKFGSVLCQKLPSDQREKKCCFALRVRLGDFIWVANWASEKEEEDIFWRLW